MLPAGPRRNRGSNPLERAFEARSDAARCGQVTAAARLKTRLSLTYASTRRQAGSSR